MIFRIRPIPCENGMAIMQKMWRELPNTVNDTYSNFIHSFEKHRDKSVLNVLQKALGIDLMPLTKIYLSWSETDEEMKIPILDNQQNTLDLIATVRCFKEELLKDLQILEKIQYNHKPHLEEYKDLEESFNIFEQENDIIDFSNHWIYNSYVGACDDFKYYFSSKAIITDLDNILASLQKIKDYGISQCFFSNW